MINSVPMGGSVVVSDTSQNVIGNIAVGTVVNLPSSAGNDYASIVATTDVAATSAAITGSGHAIGMVGYVRNFNSANILPLAVPLEAKLDNYAGTITTVFNVYSQLASNVAGATINYWYGTFNHIASNAGTITVAAACTLQLDNNTGSITSLVGTYIPTVNGGAGTVTLMYGLYFAAQTLTVGNKYAVYNNDAAAPIFSLAPVITNPVAVASLPAAASALAGGRMFVTDANATTFNSVVAGGGTNKVPVFCDGTNWRIG